MKTLPTHSDVHGEDPKKEFYKFELMIGEAVATQDV